MIIHYNIKVINVQDKENKAPNYKVNTKKIEKTYEVC